MVTTGQSSFPGPAGPASASARTAHFVVIGYGETPHQTAPLVESIYSEIRRRIAFPAPPEDRPYRVLLYRTAAEYREKTRQPDWSGATKMGHDVYAYESPHLTVSLAHEIAHLVFGEYLGERAERYTWLNEGLAMAMEARFDLTADVSDHREAWDRTVASAAPLTWTQIASFRPLHRPAEDVALWYATAASLTSFLLEADTPHAFSLLLRQLRAGVPVEAAVRNAYPQRFAGMEEAIDAWRRERISRRRR